MRRAFDCFWRELPRAGFVSFGCVKLISCGGAGGGGVSTPLMASAARTVTPKITTAINELRILFWRLLQ